MKKIDIRGFELHNLLTTCYACKIQVRKTREKEFGWEMVRVVHRPYNNPNIVDDEIIVWACPRCITEFVDMNDEETKRNIKEYKMGKPGRPPVDKRTPVEKKKNEKKKK